MIAVEDIGKRFGEVVAVDRLDFMIDRGEVVGLLGPNGAGKSTTMRILTGVLEPDQGRVLLDGTPIDQDLAEAKSRIGYLPESNPLYEEMLTAEYLEFTARLHRLGPDEARRCIADAVDETGLQPVFYRPIGELSKGYRQRVGLAAAILHRPEILVLDEPTEGLDPHQRVDIRNLVSQLGEERTVLLSSHVMQEVEATCRRLLILRRGKLVADGAVQELTAGRGGAARYLVEAAGEGVVETLARLDGVTGHESETVNGRTRVHLTSASGAELRPSISTLASERGWVLWELHREKETLEQLFRQLTADEVGEDSGPTDDPEEEATPTAAHLDHEAPTPEEENR